MTVVVSRLIPVSHTVVDSIHRQCGYVGRQKIIFGISAQQRQFAFKAKRPQTIKDQRWDFENKNPYHAERKESSIDHLAQGQLYTPEALQTIQLTIHLNKLVTFGYEEEGLLQRYGDRAALLAQGFKPKELGLILNAFARTKHLHEELLSTFATTIPPRLPGMNPQGLALTCNAYAKFPQWAKKNPHKIKKLFRRISQEIPHKLPMFEGQGLANIAYAYGQLGIKDNLLFDDLMDEVLRRPEEFNVQELTMLTKAFSQDTETSVRKTQFWNTICYWFLEQRMEIEPYYMVTILNCLSKVNHGHKKLFDTFAQDLTVSIEQLNFVQCCLVVNAFGRIREYDIGLFEVLSKRLKLLLSQPLDDAGKVNLCASIVHSYGRLHQPVPDELFLAISHTLRQHEDIVSSQGLTNLVHGMARLNIKDTTLLGWIAKQIVKSSEKGEFTPEALCVVLYSYARLKVRSEVLIYLLSQQLLKAAYMPKLSGQGVGMILYSLAKLKIEDDRLINACKKQARLLGPNLNQMEVYMIVHALSQLNRLDEQLSAILNERIENLEEIPITQEDDWWASWSPPDEMETHGFRPASATSPVPPVPEEKEISKGRRSQRMKVDETIESSRDFVDYAPPEDVPRRGRRGRRSVTLENAEESISMEASHPEEQNEIYRSPSSPKENADASPSSTDRDNLWTILEQSDATDVNSLKAHFRVSENTRGRKGNKPS